MVLLSLKSELCDSFSHLSGGNDVQFLRLGHKRPGPCAPPLGVLALWWPSLSRRDPSRCPGRATEVLWPTVLQPPPRTGFRPSSPSIPSVGSGPPAQEEACPQVLGSQQHGEWFYATKFVMVGSVSQDPVASPPTPLSNL